MLYYIISIAVVLTSIILFSLFLFFLLYLNEEKNQVKNRQTQTESFLSSTNYQGGITANTKKKAIIHCNIIPPEGKLRFTVKGFTDCAALHSVFFGNTDCTTACLGGGNCAQVCPQDAIILKSSRIFVQDSCTGCGLCLPICPKGLIELLPISQTSRFDCAGRMAYPQGQKPACPTAEEGYAIDAAFFSKTDYKKVQN